MKLSLARDYALLKIREISRKVFWFSFLNFAANFADVFLFFMKDQSNSKLIALLTDFGTKDYFVGAMKGVILSINPHVRIVDITHDIEPQNIAAARFNLRACYRNFPPQTIFVAVVDPGVGSARKAILVETDDYFFIAPDNGLLSFIYNENEKYRVYELTDEHFFAEKLSATFHGRDIFAPVAAHLSNGTAASSFGGQTKNYIHLPEIKPQRLSATEIEAEIIYADCFGNLVTNLTDGDLPPSFALRAGELTITQRRKYFAEAEKGEIFVIFGSTGFLEIVVFQDSAQKILKAQIGQKIVVTNC